MNLNLDTRWVRVILTTRRDFADETGDEMPRYDTASTTGSQVERAEPTHIGFAPPDYGYDDKRKP